MSWKTPPNHETLRALVELITRAAQQKDEPSLENLLTISRSHKGITAHEKSLLEIVLADSIDDTSRDNYYRLYTKEQANGARSELDKIAYGDFNEAMYALEVDLRNIDPTIPREMRSTIYNPKYFTQDEQQLWDQLFAPIQKYLQSSRDITATDAEDAIRALRSYQQSFYGPLLPVLSASYATESNGVTIALCYDDPTLIVKSAAPFNEELDVFFDKHPVESQLDLAPGALPQEIGGYKLVDTSMENLFRYEIEL